MISRKELISDVIKDSQDVYYFVFDKKHKWSIFHNEKDNNVCLIIYPEKNKSIEEIKNADLSILSHVVYESADFRTIEAKESFKELYKIIQEKLYDIDQEFDDILEIF